jgi:L-lactate dehydrogenase complex protein LldG
VVTARPVEDGAARAEVLRRIRDANARADVRDAPAVERAYRTSGEHPAGSSDVLDLFEHRLVDYKASVTRTAAGALRDAVVATLAGLPANSSRGQRLDRGTVLLPPGLPEDWAPEGVRDSPDLTAADLDRMAAVVTACTVGCAETGTIVLDGSPDQGRRAITLVPDVHVCVVRADQVVHSVPDMLVRVDGTRPVTLVSGPSATSDIELDRVEGVHGPRTLAVILVTDQVTPSTGGR